MLNLRRVFFVATAGFISLAPAAFAETAAVPYDPVARAIALGLTPEIVNAAFDSAMNAAESCDAAALEMQAMGCETNDFAATLTVALPAAES